MKWLVRTIIIIIVPNIICKRIIVSLEMPRLFSLRPSKHQCARDRNWREWYRYKFARLHKLTLTPYKRSKDSGKREISFFQIPRTETYFEPETNIREGISDWVVDHTFQVISVDECSEIIKTIKYFRAGLHEHRCGWRSATVILFLVFSKFLSFPDTVEHPGLLQQLREERFDAAFAECIDWCSAGTIWHYLIK